VSARERIAILLAALVLAACAGYAARIAGHTGIRAEWRRTKIAAIAPETAERLAHLQGDVLLSYFATPAREMPAHLARVEEGVVLVLEALKRASDGRLDYQVVHPADDPELEGWLDAVGIAPFRTRRVERDGYVEEEVWSTLQIAYGARPTATVSAIAEEHLPRLQSLILARLDQLEAPRAPVIALDVPHAADGAGTFDELTALLRARADVRIVDFDAEATLPDDADLFFWMEPRSATPAHLLALREFTERGRSVVLAGSRLRLEPAGVSAEGRAAWRTAPSGYPAEVLLGSIGLRPLAGFALDGFCASPRSEGTEAPVLEPFRVRCIAPNQDFRSMRGQPNASLLFEVPTVFEPDGARLAALGRRATVLATTSNRSWLGAPPTGPFTADDFPPVAEDLGAKRALAVLVEGDDPARGAFVVLAASTPFADGQLARSGFAHRKLAGILLDTLASDERLALNRTALTAAEPLAQLGRGERALWRAFACGLVPLLLAAIAGARSARGRTRGAARDGVWWHVALLGSGAALFAGALGAFAPRAGFDLTRDGRNALAPETLDIARAPGPPLAIELVFSPEDRLPPELRPLVRRARDLTARLARAAPGIELRSIAPDTADLPALGVRPFQMTSTFDEVTTVRTLVSAIRIVRQDGRGLPDNLPCESLASFEDLEFRLARALRRARAPEPEAARIHVAVACDVPRLSPAESLLEYTQLGLFAPTQGDVYGAARAALARDDFRVTFVDPTAPVLPADTDVIVWLQPRRSITPMLEVAAGFLARGGALILAAQHFDIIPRQFGESRAAFWPQPQFADVERHYFGPLGVELVREVLCDELSAPLAVDTIATGEAPPSPFQIRAALSGTAAGADPTRGLGDLLFPAGNRLRLDTERLAAHGLRARPLVFTSGRAWTYDWRGGVLPAEVLQGRGALPPAPDDARRFLPEPAPLVVLVEGRFPAFDPEAEEPQLALVPQVGGAEGKLLFIGSSQMFRGTTLAADGFRHDQFLVNAVTALTLGEEYLAILARRPVSVGLGYVAPETRLAWRTVVIGAAPLLLLLAGLLFRILSGGRGSRAPRAARVRGGP